MSVENGWDEVWVAVKFQTNLEIAGSLRNSFRASVVVKHNEGRALIIRWPHLEVLNIAKLRISLLYTRQSVYG